MKKSSLRLASLRSKSKEQIETLQLDMVAVKIFDVRLLDLWLATD